MKNIYFRDGILIYYGNPAGYLSEGGGMDMTVEAAKGRRIRIYQLKQDSPFMMRFISLAEREKRGFAEIVFKSE